MNQTIDNLSRLCIHTITTKPWTIEESIHHFSQHGVKGITVWRDSLSGRDITKIGKSIRDAGIEIVSLCRGGFFSSTNEVHRQTSIEDNLLAIDEAAALGAPLLVLVCGSDPCQSLEDSRIQIEEGIAAILPQAIRRGVKLAIEPLHPMYADSRSAINTLKQANDLAEKLNSPFVGVAVDVYHVWWDPSLEKEILRCGKLGKLFAFHVCDWLTPTKDLLLDRGLMGEGCIPVSKIRNWVEATGFIGFIEVEIFSERHWQKDQGTFLQEIINAYQTKT